MPTPKKYPGLFVILVIIVIILGIWIGALIFEASASENPNAPSAYAAVYLTTGDIYYGKLNWFPSPHLTDVWLLQKGTGSTATEFGMTPFTSAFWGPIDEVYLNPNQIVFWTYLRNNSQVAQALSNPALLQQLLGREPQAQSVPPISTSSFKGPTIRPPGVQ